MGVFTAPVLESVVSPPWMRSVSREVFIYCPLCESALVWALRELAKNARIIA